VTAPAEGPVRTKHERRSYGPADGLGLPGATNSAASMIYSVIEAQVEIHRRACASRRRTGRLDGPHTNKKATRHRGKRRDQDAGADLPATNAAALQIRYGIVLWSCQALSRRSSI